MIDSAHTSPTLRGEQQLPPHRLQDSGIEASAMRHVVPSDNAASTLRPHKRGEAILDSPRSGSPIQRLAGMQPKQPKLRQGARKAELRRRGR